MLLEFSYSDDEGKLKSVNIDDGNLQAGAWVGDRLTSTLMLHASGENVVHIDPQWIVNISVPDNAKSVRVRIRVTSPFPENVKDFREDLEFDLIWNSHEWTVRGASLPWFEG